MAPNPAISFASFRSKLVLKRSVIRSACKMSLGDLQPLSTTQNYMSSTLLTVDSLSSGTELEFHQRQQPKFARGLLVLAANFWSFNFGVWEPQSLQPRWCGVTGLSGSEKGGRCHCAECEKTAAHLLVPFVRKRSAELGAEGTTGPQEVNPTPPCRKWLIMIVTYD